MKMPSFLQHEKSFLVILFLVAFAIRLFIGLVMFTPPIDGDANTYETFGISILQGQGIRWPMHPPSSVYMPLYPMFLAAIYFLGGHHHFLVVVIQAVLSAVMCMVIYFLARRLFNEKIAWISAIFLCFNLAFIYAPRKILSEILYSFLLLLAVLFLVKFLQDYKMSDILLAAICFSLATLTRSLIFLFPFFICAYLTKVLLKQIRLRAAVRAISLFIVVFLFPIVIWTIRNYRVHRAFIPLTTMGAQSLYASYTPYAGKIFGYFTYDEVFEKGCRVATEVERDKYYLSKFIKYIRANYDKIPKLVSLKILYFFSLFDWEILGDGVYNFSFVFILPFLFFGLRPAFKYKNNISVWLIDLFLFYNFFICLIFYGSPRLRMPLEPFMILFSAVGLYNLFERSKEHRVIYLSFISIFLILNFLGFIYSGNTKYIFKFILRQAGVW